MSQTTGLSKENNASNIETLIKEAAQKYAPMPELPDAKKANWMIRSILLLTFVMFTLALLKRGLPEIFSTLPIFLENINYFIVVSIWGIAALFLGRTIGFWEKYPLRKSNDSSVAFAFASIVITGCFFPEKALPTWQWLLGMSSIFMPILGVIWGGRLQKKKQGHLTQKVENHKQLEADLRTYLALTQRAHPGAMTDARLFLEQSAEAFAKKP